MYKKYRDVAEFRMVYIREAHALDSRRPSRPAREKDISEHENFDQRCTTAKMLFDDEKLTIPCLIDTMDNSTDKAYSAKPDRAFLIGMDGKLAVAGGRGPRGFKPALDDIKEWLDKHKEPGKEKEAATEEKMAADEMKSADKKEAADEKEAKAKEESGKEKEPSEKPEVNEGKGAGEGEGSSSKN